MPVVFQSYNSIFLFLFQSLHPSLQTHSPPPKDMCIITISFEQEKVQVMEIINAGTKIHQCLRMNYKSRKQTAGARHDRLTLVKLFFPIYHCGMFDIRVSFGCMSFFPFLAFPDTYFFQNDFSANRLADCLKLSNNGSKFNVYRKLHTLCTRTHTFSIL